MLSPLNSDDRRAVTKLYRELARGKNLSQEQLNALVAEWEPKVRPDGSERAENFMIARTDGTGSGVIGPRWAFHLLGLRHGAAEIGFHTARHLIVLQRRHPTKQDWPGAWDMAVAGHVPVKEDGTEQTFLQGAWKEIDEEIGLRVTDAARTLAEGYLLPIGEPYLSFDSDEQRNPPFYNAEVRQLFGATLTGEGLAQVHFADNEVAGLLLVGVDTAWNLLAQETVASGMRYSLPRYLDWLEKQQPSETL